MTKEWPNAGAGTDRRRRGAAQLQPAREAQRPQPAPSPARSSTPLKRSGRIPMSVSSSHGETDRATAPGRTCTTSGRSTTEPPRDWDRSHPNMMFYESFRNYPKVTIAQVHGHCLGGGMALMTAHDIAIAADTAKIGMPEIVRGSFGQMALSSLYHTGITAKKAALMHYSGRNFSGDGGGPVRAGVGIGARGRARGGDPPTCQGDRLAAPRGPGLRQDRGPDGQGPSRCPRPCAPTSWWPRASS